MILEVNRVPVYFPYEQVYPEQLRYIKAVLDTIETKGHCLIEMPSGTGKTIAMLSATVSYLAHCRANSRPFKIIYCSRTVPEIAKTLKELKGLIAYINTHTDFGFLGLGLSRRINMCINEDALRSADVDLACRRRTSRLDGLHCDFYENSMGPVPPGVYDFEDIRALGRAHGVCPYFLVRECLQLCDCVVYTYNYMIDPAVYSIVSKDFPDDSVVVFDEAHNIDAHCIEALSVELNRGILEAATKMLRTISTRIQAQQGDRIAAKISTATEGSIPYFYTENVFECIPGNIRSSLHFVSAMKRLVEFFKTKLKTSHLTSETIRSFVQSIYDLTFVEKKTLQFCSQRLGLLVQSLDIEDEALPKLRRVADFATTLGLYSRGFAVIFEPYDSMAGVFNPVLRLCCLDASIAIAHVFKRFKNVLVTSGTLSPIEMYPRILNFVPAHSWEIGATLDRNCISPLIITKGNDQMLLRSRDDEDVFRSSLINSEAMPTNSIMVDESTGRKNKLTTSFSLRSDPSVVRNYGNLLMSLSKTVPDNIVCFFPSYIYMEEIVTIWSETEVIKEILKNKLIFVETPDSRETMLALKNYRQACDSGRGAILLSVARGKISEGVDFEHGYGRAVVVLGVPFMYTESVRLKERLRYLRMEYSIKEYDFLVFDAMRHAAQCLGRVLRNKSDYGLMVMADCRFGQLNMAEKMPRWIREMVEKGNTGLSIDMALNISKAFFREMAQSVEGAGNSMLDEKAAAAFLDKI